MTQAKVIAVDLPGHGESSAPRAGYTATYFTDTVEGFLEASGSRGAALAGEPIGGAATLALATRHNPRVTRVVALNPNDCATGAVSGAARHSATCSSQRCCGRPPVQSSPAGIEMAVHPAPPDIAHLICEAP